MRLNAAALSLVGFTTIHQASGNETIETSCQAFFLDDDNAQAITSIVVGTSYVDVGGAAAAAETGGIPLWETGDPAACGFVNLQQLYDRSTEPPTPVSCARLGESDDIQWGPNDDDEFFHRCDPPDANGNCVYLPNTGQGLDTSGLDVGFYGFRMQFKAQGGVGSGGCQRGSGSDRESLRKCDSACVDLEVTATANPDDCKDLGQCVSCCQLQCAEDTVCRDCCLCACKCDNELETCEPQQNCYRSRPGESEVCLTSTDMSKATCGHTVYHPDIFADPICDK